MIRSVCQLPTHQCGKHNQKRREKNQHIYISQTAGNRCGNHNRQPQSNCRHCRQQCFETLFLGNSAVPDHGTEHIDPEEEATADTIPWVNQLAEIPAKPIIPQIGLYKTNIICPPSMPDIGRVSIACRAPETQGFHLRTNHVDMVQSKEKQGQSKISIFPHCHCIIGKQWENCDKSACHPTVKSVHTLLAQPQDKIGHDCSHADRLADCIDKNACTYGSLQRISYLPAKLDPQCIQNRVMIRICIDRSLPD